MLFSASGAVQLIHYMLDEGEGALYVEGGAQLFPAQRHQTTSIKADFRGSTSTNTGPVCFTHATTPGGDVTG